MRIFVFLVLAALVLAVVALFSAQNAGPVTVWFYNWKFSSSLAIVILLALFLGAAVMALIFLSVHLRRRFGKKVVPGVQGHGKPAPRPAGDAPEAGFSSREGSTTPPQGAGER